MKRAFTMIELIFVIVVLGILAGIAIPKFAATRTDAVITKGKSEVATIRSAIIQQSQTNILAGKFNEKYQIENMGNVGGRLFTGIGLDMPNSQSEGKWSQTGGGNGKAAQKTYKFYVTKSDTVDFTYDPSNGKFDCAKSAKYCDILSE